MTWVRLVRAELRKLTTTKMPWGFLGVLVVISATTAIAVIFGKDADGTKGFIATAADQASLMAFGANAMIVAGLFGAIAVSREYGHNSVVPMFLAEPRRARAMLAQLAAVLLGGGLLGFVGAGLTVMAVGISLPFVHYDFMVNVGDLIRLMLASAFAGAVGAIIGAGAAAVLRNTGGAVTAAVVLLLVLPPIAVQLVNSVASWVPSALTNALSGVSDQVAGLAALGVLAAWALVFGAIALVAVQRRDIV